MDARTPLPITPEEARGSVELVTAIYESALTGSRVSLPLGSDSRFYEGITLEDYDGRQTQPSATEAQPA